MNKLFVCLFSLLFFCGCVTDGVNYKSDKYNFFFTPVDHISKLMKETKCEESAKIYNNEINYFHKNRPKYDQLLINISSCLNKKYIPLIDSTISEIEKVNWPVPVSEWRNISELLTRTNEIFANYSSLRIIKNTNNWDGRADLLKLKLTNLRNDLIEKAPKFFTEFPLYEDDFFKLYPVEVNISDFFLVNKDILNNVFHQYTSDQLIRTYKFYGAFFTEHQKSDFSRACFKSKLKESLITSPDLKNLVRIYLDIKNSGFPINIIPDTKIELIEVTAKDSGKNLYPLSIKDDFYLTSKRTGVDEMDKILSESSSNYLIVLDVPKMRVNRKIERKEKVPSKIHIRNRIEPNPDYNLAQNVVNLARDEYNQAQIALDIINNQYCYGYGCMAKLVNVALAVGIVKKAQANLGEAMSRLSSTPMMIEKAEYSSYEFNKVYIYSEKFLDLTYYLIDRNLKTINKGIITLSDNKNFSVCYDIHENDPGKGYYLRNMDQEESIEKFEEVPLNISRSDLLSKITATGNPSQTYLTLTVVCSEIRDKKDADLRQIKFSKEVKEPIFDNRFESVVEVLSPKGSAVAGFFIKDNLIITNYHITEGAKFVEIRLINGNESFGKIISTDERLDLALIRTEAKGKPIEFLKDTPLSLGTSVEAIGHPKGFKFSITRGVISGIREIKNPKTAWEKPVTYIQTDAAISPGNSGGPLLLGEKVIGINTQKLISTGTEGIGFAVHYSEILNYLENILK